MTDEDIVIQTQTAQAFSKTIADSPELQARIGSMTSVGELMALTHELGFQFTGDDLKSLAQNAYQQWLTDLQPQSRPFFERLHADEALTQRHQDCHSPDDVMALAAEYDFDLTEADLQQAAQAAAAQEGFSFEKLWFKNLGMI